MIDKKRYSMRFMVCVIAMVWMSSYAVARDIDENAQRFFLSEKIQNYIATWYPVTPPTSVISIQSDCSLCPEEKLFLQNRSVVTQQALQNYFSVNQPLRIGLCCSGGGNRAMIGMLGFLKGMHDTHLFDVLTYIAAVSGSTWLVAPVSYLLAQGYANSDVSILLQDISNFLSTALSLPIVEVDGYYAPAALPICSDMMVYHQLVQRYAYGQPITAINLFGPLVAEYALGLLEENRLTVLWSDIAQTVQNGTMPLPLCASIFNKPDGSYGWFEMSPLQAGSVDLGYIPVAYLGSKFSQGVLQQECLCSEYPLSFFLGMYGSGFAAPLEEIWQNIKKRNILTSIESYIHTCIYNVLQSQFPDSYAQFLNYSADIANSTLYQQTYFGLFDAGIDSNFPIPTLFDRPERSVDLIFMYDSHPGDLQSLTNSMNYIQSHNLAIPDLLSMTPEQLSQQSMTVLNDPRSSSYDASLITICYFPSVGIDVTTPPYGTINFKYTAEEIVTYSGQMEQAVISNIAEITSVMQLLFLS